MSRILVSTDIGSDPDDALALLAMFNQGLDVEAIYTVNGDVNTRGYIARHLVDLSGKDVVVARGDSKPMAGPLPFKFFEENYIPDKFIVLEPGSELEYVGFKKANIRRNGFADLASRLSVPQAVFSLGPLTIIARIVKECPDAARNIERVYVMGCRFGAPEHNIRHDFLAAHTVFSSGIPITVIPGNVCEKFRPGRDFLENLVSPAGKYAKHMALGYIAARTATNLNLVCADEKVSSKLGLIGKLFAEGIEDNRKKYDKMRRVENFVRDLNDSGYASFAPNEYFNGLNEIINFLRARKDVEFAAAIASKLEGAVPKTLSVSDVYVPYCFSFPERLKTRKGTVVFEMDGNSKLLEGERHEVVTEIDYSDFESYLKKFCR